MRRIGALVLAVAGLGVSSAAFGAAWSLNAVGDWSDTTKWVGGTLPISTTNAFLDSGSITVSTPGAVAALLRIGNGSQGVGDGVIGATLTIVDGGTLSAASTAGINGGFRIGEAAGLTGHVIQTGGDVTLPAGSELFVGLRGTGYYAMSGGTLNVPASAFTLARLNNTSSGYFTQTGGVVTAPAITMNGPGSGLGLNAVYEISGGTLNLTSATDNLVFAGGSTFRVKGGGGTINMAGLLGQTIGGGVGNTEFVLDNSAKHISPINSTKTNFRDMGNVKPSLAGGVLLANTDHFTLFHVGGYDKGFHFPVAGTPTSATGLWDMNDPAASDQDTIITMAHNQGTLDANGTLAAAFAAAKYGNVDLANVAGLTSMDVRMDVVGGTLSNFTNALDAAGISWTADTGEYNLKVTGLNPSVAGSSKFAWDFTNIDAAMAIDKISLVPEPTMAAIFGLSTLMTLSMRRRSQPR